MSKIRTHYDNLQVKENASIEVIKGAHRYLSQKWHPDKNPSNREEAERVFKIINEAYEILSNPTKRKEHDTWILRQKEAEAASSTQSPPHNDQQRNNAEQRTSDPALANYKAGMHFAYILKSRNVPISTKLGYIAAHVLRNWVLYGIVVIILVGAIG